MASSTSGASSRSVRGSINPSSLKSGMAVGVFIQSEKPRSPSWVRTHAYISGASLHSAYVYTVAWAGVVG